MVFVPQFRSPDHSWEISLDSSSVDRLYWSLFRCCDRQGSLNHGQIHKPESSYCKDSDKFLDLIKELSSAVRTYGSLCIHNPTCQIASPMFLGMAQDSLHTEHTRPTQASICFWLGSGLPQLVKELFHGLYGSFFQASLTTVITLDSSLLEQRAHVWLHTIQGKWSLHVCLLYISLLELRAVRNACIISFHWLEPSPSRS